MSPGGGQSHLSLPQVCEQAVWALGECYWDGKGVFGENWETSRHMLMRRLESIWCLRWHLQT